MWEGFEYNRDVVCRDIFLQNLAVAIIDEKILDIPPAVMQQLVTCLADRQMWKVKFMFIIIPIMKLVC